MRNYPYHPRGKSGPAVPWEMISPHEEQAYHNHGQTLQRLAERGGLDPNEMLAVLTDSRYDANLSEDEVIGQLRLLVTAWNKRVDEREPGK